MSDSAVGTDRLDSWKAIASYVGRDVRTVIRWEKQKGLPVHRIPGGQRQAVFAYSHEIDEWMNHGGADAVAATHPVEPVEEPPHLTIQVQAETPTNPRSKRPRIAPSTIGVVLAMILLASFLLAAASRWIAPKRFVFAGETQITTDGAIKQGLVTNGRQLYFGEWRDGRIILVSASVNGGRVTEIPTPFVQARPVGISADGRKLLVLAGEGPESDRALWAILVHGGSPERVANIVCHAASWSPDGRLLAYATGNSVYLATENGSTSYLLQRFSGIPDALQWSLDGKGILFRLRDMNTLRAAVWEIKLSETDPPSVDSLVSLTRQPAEYGVPSPLIDRDDDVFIGEGREQSTILALEKPWLRWKSVPRFVQFVRENANVSDLALDRASQRLYVNKEVERENELDWFDKTSHQFHPFLSGVSAHDVDFSPDGHSIVYLRMPDESMWVANADGGAARQLDLPAIQEIELPRWSPGGKEIAFMGQRAGSPSRIYIVDANGGTSRQASEGTDNQGAPTWSPDGKHLVYGRVFCQEENTCAIEWIDLATRRQTMIPGSEGLSTARWSPDGRYIAALRSDLHKVFLFDCRSTKWRMLADGINGDDLAWAPDSSAVYASRPSGDRPEVVRIYLKDGHQEPAVDLSAFSKLSGRVDTWFAVTPDNSILFVHIASGNEIYALHYVVQ